MSADFSLYPEDVDRTDYWEMLIEDPGSGAGSQRSSMLLDTNVVRNVVDYVRNPGNKPSTVVDRLQNLKRKDGYSCNGFWGIGEDCYRRVTRDFDAAKAAEQMLLVKHFFESPLGQRLAVDTVEYRNSVEETMQFTSQLGKYIEVIVKNRIVPRYICVLKLRQIYRDTAVSLESANTYLSWFLDELDIFPMHEALLGLTLLAPQRDLTEMGVRWRRIAHAIFKVDKQSDPARWSWGAAWDLTIARVREATESLSFELFAGSGTLPKSTLLVTNERVITELTSSVFRGPRMSDIFAMNVTSEFDMPVEVYSVPKLFKSETSLGRRLIDFHIERARVMAKRADEGQFDPPIENLLSIQRELEESVQSDSL